MAKPARKRRRPDAKLTAAGDKKWVVERMRRGGYKIASLLAAEWFIQGKAVTRDAKIALGRILLQQPGQHEYFYKKAWKTMFDNEVVRRDIAQKVGYLLESRGLTSERYIDIVAGLVEMAEESAAAVKEGAELAERRLAFQQLKEAAQALDHLTGTAEEAARERAGAPLPGRPYHEQLAAEIEAAEATESVLLGDVASDNGTAEGDAAP